jgi:hypothetical protein
MFNAKCMYSSCVIERVIEFSVYLSHVSSRYYSNSSCVSLQPFYTKHTTTKT